MRARLISLDEGTDIPVGGGPVLIGRNPRCDARLESIRVSRLHCCLAAGDGGVLVRDLLSTNGTRINGQPVERGQLRPGDELSIAHLRFRLEDEPECRPLDGLTERSPARPPLQT